MWAIGILIVVVIALGVFAAHGQLGQLGPELPDRPGPDLPDGELSADDVKQIHFAVVTRGYEMSQVDAVLARLEGQLRCHETGAFSSSLEPAVIGSVTSGSASSPDLGDNGSTGVSDGVHDDEKRGSNGSNEAPNR
ncbi:DivIVA domain-containing protein [Propionibacterium cyclohexanicum]|uniref:DivIVA domain-containing protein n=1 Tax=Propionibacterium cyclohexanicum TaxID=64702 RepID=A0A1H9PGR1_9ACTN|nr:DivIVA domain-containing protein [Propionibacterium cyclohexanicum]SER47049.1 DivIVA domain-containing protein [Propionibacterium cyclohexanicum]